MSVKKPLIVLGAILASSMAAMPASAACSVRPSFNPLSSDLVLFIERSTTVGTVEEKLICLNAMENADAPCVLPGLLQANEPIQGYLKQEGSDFVFYPGHRDRFRANAPEGYSYNGVESCGSY